MRTSVLPVLATILASASADFYVSNTTVCMGAGPFLSHCTRGVNVLTNISNGTKDEAPFTCSNLIHAEDNNYIHNGTMAPVNGSLYVSSANGVCGSGQLNFEKDWHGIDGVIGGPGHAYIVTDKDGKHVGDCVPEMNATAPARHTQCNQWVGVLYFATAFRCNSTICD